MLNDASGFKKVYIACGYSDLRRGIDRFANMIQQEFKLDPFMPGILFLFCGRKTDRVKGLLWEGDGFLLLYKRLESGNFQWPRNETEVKAISSQQYKWLMEGLSIEQNLPVIVINHELSEEELKERLGDKWKRLPDEVYKRLAFRPAKFEVEEHHVAVYAGSDNQTIIRGKRPVDLLRNSIVTPSLEAAIINSKYVNAIPLYRLEQEFSRNDVVLSRPVMANWTIKCAERYLSLLYDRLHKEIYNSKVLQADELCVA